MPVPLSASLNGYGITRSVLENSSLESPATMSLSPTKAIWVMTAGGPLPPAAGLGNFTLANGTFFSANAVTVPSRPTFTSAGVPAPVPTAAETNTLPEAGFTFRSVIRTAAARRACRRSSRRASRR